MRLSSLECNFKHVLIRVVYVHTAIRYKHDDRVEHVVFLIREMSEM